jgi:hypothetical protein
MQHRTSIRFDNASADPVLIVLEPYASEFQLPSGSSCEIVGRSDELVPEIFIEYTAKAIFFWGNSPHAIYEYWQDGRLVD